MTKPALTWVLAFLFSVSGGVPASTRADESDVDKKLLDELDADLLDDDRAENKQPTGGAASEKTGTVDEELLRDLDEDLGDTAGEAVPLTRDSEAPVEELGEETDPLTQIGHKMRLAETLVPERAEFDRTKICRTKSRLIWRR